MKLQRRDFLNGSLLALGSLALPPLALGQQLEQLISNDYYPPILQGIRGSHPGSFEVAHALAMYGQKEWPAGEKLSESSYDLVVVGAGISGLAAAKFYQQAMGTKAKILILDNHNDFGGHATRNEFELHGKTYIGYGGSQSLESPSEYSSSAKDLLKDLGLKLEHFKTAYDQSFFNKHGLKAVTYFDKQTYGRNQIVPYSLTEAIFYEIPGLVKSKMSTRRAVQQMPLEEEAKKQLLKLLQTDSKFLGTMSWDDFQAMSWNYPYYDYLKDKLQISHPQVFQLLRMLPAGDYGSGADSISLLEAAELDLPGINLEKVLTTFDRWMLEMSMEEEEPYIFHFPDGNATISRLLVRDLIPAVAPGKTQEDIVLARFNYQNLDQDGANVRLRLNSTVVNATHAGPVDKANKVNLTYVQNGKSYQVQANHCVMAGYNRMIPHLVPEMPKPQIQALKQLVKAPLVYTNVLIDKWQPLKDLGIGSAYCPGCLHSTVSMDYPVSLGGYDYPHSPQQPALLHMEYIPVSPVYGAPLVDQYGTGRTILLGTPFSVFESQIKEQLDGLLGPAGFDVETNLKAITVNRWSHGYAFAGDSLNYNEDQEEPHLIGRKPFGRIAIANSDSGGSAYVDSAIDQALRAVQDLVG